MLRRSLFSLAVLALTSGFFGCRAISDALYESQRAEIERHFESLHSIKDVQIFGYRDGFPYPPPSFWAAVELTSGGRLEFTGLSAASFQGDAPVWVTGADGFKVRLVGFGEVSGVRSPDGEPIAHRFNGAAIGLGAGSDFSDQLSHPLANVTDAVARYDEIISLLRSWPPCPAYAERSGESGTQYRYCAWNSEGYGGAGSDYPAFDPRWQRTLKAL